MRREAICAALLLGASVVAAAAAEPDWPRVVVVVNDRTGRVSRSVNRPWAETNALVEALEKQDPSWRILMTSTSAGFGATFCVSKQGQYHFFYSHPHTTLQEATSAARDKARVKAAELNDYAYVCGRPWQVVDRLSPDSSK